MLNDLSADLFAFFNRLKSALKAAEITSELSNPESSSFFRGSHSLSKYGEIDAGENASEHFD